MLNLNTNLIHNVLNWVSLLLAGATAILMTSGCTSMVTGAIDCTASWINPIYSAYAISGIMVLKTILNVLRDGIGGLFKVQPPIREDATIASPGKKK